MTTTLLTNLNLTLLFGTLAFAIAANNAQAEWPGVVPERTNLSVRRPHEFSPAPLRHTLPPPVVGQAYLDRPQWRMSLDEAIGLALANSEVVRVLSTGNGNSGSTVYDAAQSHTAIDEQQGVFDPTLTLQNNFTGTDTPNAVLDPTNPTGTRFVGGSAENHNFEMTLSQRYFNGGNASMRVSALGTRFPPPGVRALNPRNSSQVELTYVHPILRGAGWAVNRAPIVLAQLDTERTYYQYQDATQELVRGVIEAYWSVVFARTDLWARQKQLESFEAAFERQAARGEEGFANASEVAQTKVAFANSRASVISAEANLLTREAALRNILGIAPYGEQRFTPVTAPLDRRLDIDWDQMLIVASEQRPDLIQLKLALESDNQRLIQAENQTLPQLDATAQYRWNSLGGISPSGAPVASGGGFDDYTLGLTFSTPLGRRASRASLRRQQITIARDRANLQQGLHGVSHVLANNLRTLALNWEQYEAFKEVREAATINLEQQLGEYDAGRAIFLNVLQAITDWGNAVSSEANALTQYNTALANLERQTGVILQTHGVSFFGESYSSVGPLIRFCKCRDYPYRLPPVGPATRYGGGDEPSEEAFDLRTPEKPERARLPEQPPNLRPLPVPEPQPLPVPDMP